MSAKVQPIFQLTQKLRGLIDWAIQVDNGAPTSERAVADAADIRWGTFKSSLTSEKMSGDRQQALGKVFGFSPEWPEWRDRNAARTAPVGERRDGSEAFLERFRAQKSSGGRLTIDAGMTNVQVSRRFANFDLALPGSFAPSSSQSGIPLVLSLSFDPKGWPALVELTVWLSEVDLQLIPPRAGTSIGLSEVTCRDSSEGNFSAEILGLPQYWRIRVADGGKKLSGTRRRNDGGDAVCTGFRDGDQIKAIMTARISDCFVTIDGIPLDDASEQKKRFVEHLSKLSALGDSAEATLAEQTLTIVEAA